ncbi:MAG: acyltransferase domain-containing protein [Candidatus Korobacteraceae bacterium]|jgi:malonyl CoA-acyl carrier protein transacylase/thioesterase domain-containing protein
MVLAALEMNGADEPDMIHRPIIVLLPGVGDQYVGMAWEHYQNWEVFRTTVDYCAEILVPHLGTDIRKIIYPDHQAWRNKRVDGGVDLRKLLGRKSQGLHDSDADNLNCTRFLQPALFTIEYAAARLWAELGVTPDKIVGHSLGEWVAACLAGVFSLEDALFLVATCARLADSLPPGRMLSVLLPEQELLPLISGDLSISCINGPNLCVVAGPPSQVEDLEVKLRCKDVIYRHVENGHAFHSRMLIPIIGRLKTELQKVQLNKPKIPFISNVSGDWIEPEQATDPAYWAMQVHCPVMFNEALRQLWQVENATLVEAGPGRTLSVLALQHPCRSRAADLVTVSFIRHSYENISDTELLRQSIRKLWSSGATIRLEKIPRTERQTIDLPNCPVEHNNVGGKQEEESKPTGQNQAHENLGSKDVKSARLEAGISVPEESLRPAPEASSRGIQPVMEQPTDEVEDRLVKIWSKMLGLKAIGIHDNFFELGGHSLLAARTVAQVEAAFEQKLPADSIFCTPTVAQMAATLRSSPVPNVIYLKGQDCSESSLVWIGGGAFLYPMARCVEGEFALCYLPLSVETLAELPRPYQMESLARCMAAKIVKFQPKGPYAVAGSCLAGMLAYETARQLEVQGQGKSLVILVDTPRAPFEEDTSISKRIKLRWKREMFNFSRLWHMTSAKKLEYLWCRVQGLKAAIEFRRWKKASESSRKRGSGPHGSSLWEIIYLASLSYRPGGFSGSLLFLQPQLRPADEYWDATPAWKELAPHFDVRQLPGDNSSVFDPPNVSTMAEYVHLAMRQMQSLEKLEQDSTGAKNSPCQLSTAERNF